jgi:hypothetical protein
MFYMGEPLLKPLLFAMVLIYRAGFTTPLGIVPGTGSTTGGNGTSCCQLKMYPATIICLLLQQGVPLFHLCAKTGKFIT